MLLPYQGKVGASHDGKFGTGSPFPSPPEHGANRSGASRVRATDPPVSSIDGGRPAGGVRGNPGGASVGIPRTTRLASGRWPAARARSRVDAYSQSGGQRTRIAPSLSARSFELPAARAPRGVRR